MDDAKDAERDNKAGSDVGQDEDTRIGEVGVYTFAICRSVSLRTTHTFREQTL